MSTKNPNFWDINNDPFLNREIQKYKNPLPSREFIMSCMAEYGKPISAKQLATNFNILNKLDILKIRLETMTREGQIFKNRLGVYALPDKMSLIKGRVSAHKDGYGWFIAEDKNIEDIYLSAKQMRRLWHGDIVLVKQVPSSRNKNKTEGIVVEIISRGIQTLVGRIKLDGKKNFAQLFAQNNQIQQIVLISKPDLNGAKDGNLVEVQILEHPSFKFQAEGKVIKIFNEDDAIDTFLEVAAKNHNIQIEFEPEVLAEAEKFDNSINIEHKNHRIDLTNLDFITIDGEDAKDFDDAIYCELTADSKYKLYVAIADVSTYVTKDSQLDLSAKARGNSVYFPERVIPMLPFNLSDNLCSLMPEVERLAMVCEMDINANGKIENFWFYQAVIKSYARLTYTQVGAFLDTMQTQNYSAAIKNLFDKKSKLENLLTHLAYLHKILLTMRYKRHAINFNRRELKVEFDGNGDITRIFEAKKNLANSLIEEFMLCANVCAAQIIQENHLPALFRNHEKPSIENLEDLQHFLHSLGLNLENGLDASAKDYENLLSQVKDRPDFEVIQTKMLRSMNQATYSEENLGHFALAYPCYTHFTSPIRRYADLLLHRAISDLIHSATPNPHIKNNNIASLTANSAVSKPKAKTTEVNNSLHNLGLHLSDKERNADTATRDMLDYLKARFMHKYLGYTFIGKVVNVTNFGLFTELEDIYIDGLIHISSLPMDYYIYDASNQCLKGKRSGKKFALGDTLIVKVAGVSIEESKIDFVICDEKSKLKFERSAKNVKNINLKILGDLNMEDKAKDIESINLDTDELKPNTPTKRRTPTTRKTSRVSKSTTATATKGTPTKDTAKATSTTTSATSAAKNSSSASVRAPRKRASTQNNVASKNINPQPASDKNTDSPQAPEEKIKFEELLKLISEQESVEDIIKVIEEAEAVKLNKKKLSKKAIDKAIDKKLAKKAAKKSEKKKEKEKLKKKIKKRQKKLKAKQKNSTDKLLNTED